MNYCEGLNSLVWLERRVAEESYLFYIFMDEIVKEVSERAMGKNSSLDFERRTSGEISLKNCRLVKDFRITCK